MTVLEKDPEGTAVLGRILVGCCVRGILRASGLRRILDGAMMGIILAAAVVGMILKGCHVKRILRAFEL